MIWNIFDNTKVKLIIDQAVKTWLLPDYLINAIHYVCGIGTPEENGYKADDYNNENGYGEPYLDVISGVVYEAKRVKDVPLTYGWVEKEQLVSVQESSKWQFIGEATGSTGLRLPSEYNELYIECAIAGGNGTVNFQIPKVALSSTTKAYSGGRYDSTVSFVSVAIMVNTTSVSLAVVKGNEGDNLSDSILKAWYR